MQTETFRVICEIEPATRPDLRRVRHQIGVLTSISSTFLIPDNHLGRATVSSIAVANEVQAMGGRSIACLNCRDRNLLGLRRDLLTAAAYGVDDFLCVYGDEPSEGGRTSQLTVRTMMEEIRGWDPGGEPRTTASFRAGVATRLSPMPSWKREADFVFVQASFSARQLIAWRETMDLACPVYAGVLVLASPSMAKTIVANLPEVDVPQALVERLDHDPAAGVEAACQLVVDIRESGSFDGVHLIPVGRYREVTARLEPLLA